MEVYVAIPAESLDFNEILVADSLDGIKMKCDRYCRAMYDELIHMRTEVSNDNTRVYVYITGEDPEEIYVDSRTHILEEVITFLMRKEETDLWSGLQC